MNFLQRGLMAFAVLTFLVNCLAPHQFWITRCCCRTTVSLQAPEYADLCPMSKSHVDKMGPDPIQIEAPGCCHTTCYQVADIIPGLPHFEPSGTVFIAAVAPTWLALIPVTHSARPVQVAQFATNPDPPNSPALYLQYTRLNL